MFEIVLLESLSPPLYDRVNARLAVIAVVLLDVIVQFQLVVSVQSTVLATFRFLTPVLSAVTSKEMFPDPFVGPA